MNEKKSGLTGIRAWWLAFPGGLLLLAMIFGFIINPSYFSASGLRNTLFSCGPMMLIAAAVAIPLSRGYADLSVLGVATISGITAALITIRAGIPAAAMILITLCIGAAIGVINGLIAMLFRRKKVIFSAAITVCIGLFYRYLSFLIIDGNPLRFPIRMRLNVFTAFLLPAICLIGIFAIFAFTAGGKHAFNGIYEEDEDRNSGTILPFLFSGMLAGCAGIIMFMRLLTVNATTFNFSASHILPLLVAGVAIPNVKKSKGGAFLGFISVIIAALGVSILQNAFILIGLHNYASQLLYTVLALVFAILNAVLGSKASKIEYVPQEKPEKTVSGASSAGTTVTAADAYAKTGKSKVAAILLAIFLGPIGVHRYYLGYGKQGFVQTLGFACVITAIFLEGPAIYRNQLGLMIFVLILLLFGLATAIWAFVDFIRIITGGLKPVCADEAPEFRTSYLSDPVPTIENETPAEPAPAVEEPVFEEKPEKEEKPAEADKPCASSMFGALAELANLYESGVITQEVYNQRKADILSKM